MSVNQTVCNIKINSVNHHFILIFKKCCSILEGVLKRTAKIIHKIAIWESTYYLESVFCLTQGPNNVSEEVHSQSSLMGSVK